MIAAWFDRRNDSGDVYAQRIGSDGSLGPTVGLEPVPMRTTFGLALSGRLPVTSTLALRLELPVAATVDVGVFDPQGRRVATIANASLPAGPNALSWNLRGPGGARVAPGVYLAVARTSTAISTVRFVTLR